MGFAAYTSKYLERDVGGRPKEWQVPLLYEHLLTHLRSAQLQIRRREAGGPVESLDHASAVVANLLASVDREAEGELAARLASVYAYFSAEVVLIRRTLDHEQLAKMIEVVASLHESWVIAARTQWPTARAAAAPADDARRDDRSRT